jgi:hypothetical protein
MRASIEDATAVDQVEPLTAPRARLPFNRRQQLGTNSATADVRMNKQLRHEALRAGQDQVRQPVDCRISDEGTKKLRDV